VYLYEELPKFKVASMRSPGVLKMVDGEEINESFLSTRSISTYPKLPTGDKDGDPIADRLYVKLHDNRAMVAVADGCNWGKRPQMAARDAVAAMTFYLTDKQEMIHDLQDAGHYLLRSFAEAHKKIVADKEDIWEAGTTTLIGVLCLELEPVNEGDPKWGVLCASVGDCKAFIASQKTRQVIDVTSGNRNNVSDGRDPGGRLGPYVGQGWPDLRNLRLYFSPCEADDVILIVSDGVHDNLDPQTLGKIPADLQLPNKSWEELTHDSLLKIKADYMRELLRDLVFSQPDITPGSISDRLISHCLEATRKSREYMEEDMSRKQPMDYIAFPGKMDHTTCVTFVVGHKGGLTA
jgi:serine/threonine protein phosphatase PrpC